MRGKNATERLLPDEHGLQRATAILRDGGIVALPTETVYGLAARADSDAAVERIYAAKGRPSHNPLIVHVHSLRKARYLAVFSQRAMALASEHWPGPLTLVLPRQKDARLAAAVSAGLPTIAVRCPAHETMRAVLEMADLPLAAPSANASGFISPTTADHVLATLEGRIDAVVDAGPCPSGVESTIVAVRADGRIDMLRPGPVTIDAQTTHERGVEAPGQLDSHYAPGKPMRLDAVDAHDDEFLIGFGAVRGDTTLSADGSLEEAATRLYACLHEAAVSRAAGIAVAPVPDTGIGRAINDRLRRAAF